MKQLLIVFASIILMGCTAQVLNWELDTANEICKDRRGISHISVGGYLLTATGVVCGNGEWFWVKPLKEIKHDD